MTGYVRVSASDIITGADIKASPLNDEFNKLRDAFSNDAAKSHTHDGSSGNSTQIALATSVSGYLPAVNGGTGGKNNFSASALPTATDDTGLGYASGSLWYNISTGKLYVCTVATASSAIWKEFGLGTTGGTTTIQDLTITGTTNLNGSATNIGNADTDAVTVVGTTTFQNNTTFGTANTDTMSIVATPTFTPQIIANGGLAGAVSGDITSTGTSALNAVTLSGAVTGGTLENCVIGGVTPASLSATTIGGTVITASTNFSGSLQGNVTGDVTGNVSAASGTSAFNNVTINGTLDVTSTQISNVTDPTNNQDAATKKYVDDQITSLINGADASLDTLGEIATLLGTDSVESALTTAIMDRLKKSGGTMSGEIDMGSQKIIALGTPTAGTDATTKTYVDGILGSATNASDSANAAATSETNAASSATNASTSETNAAASLASFQSIYHGANATDPSGLSASDYGDLTFNTTSSTFKVYTSGGWVGIGVQTNATSNRFSYLANVNGLQTDFTGADLAGNTLAFTGVYIDVYKNGVKQSLQNNDYSLSGGNTVTFPSALAANDVVEMVTFNAFTLASTSSLMPLTGGGFTGDVIFNGDSANIQWDKSDNALEILDGAKLVIGSSGTGGDFHITDEPGYGSVILTDTFKVKDSTNTSTLFRAMSSTNGVEIYQNGLVHFETKTDGVRIKSSAQNATGKIYVGSQDTGILQDATWVKITDKGNNVVFRGSSSGGDLTYQDDTRVLAHINGVNLEGIVSLQATAVQHGTFSSLNERRYDLINDLSGNTLAWDIRKATVFDLELTSTSITSMTLSGGHAGGANEATGFTLRVVQPASGSLPSITWDSNIKWVAGTPPTLTSTNGAIDVITFVSMQGHYYGFVTGLNVS